MVVGYSYIKIWIIPDSYGRGFFMLCYLLRQSALSF